MKEQPIEWTRELLRLVQHDANCQQCLSKVMQLEPAYERIKKKLSKQDKETLDLYIAACEEYEYSHIYSAYALGQIHARGKSTQ